MLIGQAGNSWDLQVDHLKMHGVIIEGKLAIWTPGVLNLINTGEERNIFLLKRVVGSARVQNSNTDEIYLCLKLSKKAFSMGRIVTGIFILTIVLKEFLLLSLCNSCIYKYYIIDQPAYKLLLVLDLQKKCKPMCFFLIIHLHGCIQGLVQKNLLSLRLYFSQDFFLKIMAELAFAEHCSKQKHNVVLRGSCALNFSKVSCFIQVAFIHLC